MNDRFRKSMRKNVLSISILLLLTLHYFPTHAQDTKENADYKLALNLYKDQLFDLAVEQFRQFVSAYPNTEQGIEARYNIGLCLMNLKKFDEARIQFQNFAVNYPQHPKAAEAWWNVGEAYVALGNSAEAASAFERLKVFNPTSKLAPDALLRAGTYFQKAGDLDNAKKVLRAIIQEYTTSQSVLTARLRYAEILIQEKNAEPARIELRKIIDGPVASLKPEALVLLGTLEFNEGKFPEAEKYFRKVMALDKKGSRASSAAVKLAMLYREQGNVSGAVELLKPVISDSSITDTSLFQTALIEYGEMSLRQHDERAALVSFNLFLKKFPGSPLLSSVLLSSARAEEFAGNLAGAAADLQRIISVLRSSIESRVAFIKLAKIAEEQKRYHDALNYYQQFSTLYPDDGGTPLALFSAAKIAENQFHDFSIAQKFYDEITVKYHTSDLIDDALLGEARCMESTQNLTKAIDDYKEVLRLYPSTDSAMVLVRHIDSLELYALKNPDLGIQRLSQIVADIIQQKPRGEDARKLADVYFYDFKDFKSAAQQYSAALAIGFTDTTAVEAVSFQRAKALQLLAAVEERSSDDATKAYDEFLNTYPHSPLSSEAQLQKLLLARDPVPPHIDSLIKNETSPAIQKEFAFKFAARAIASKNTETALCLLQPYMTNDEYALYLSSSLLDSLNQKDSATTLRRTYIDKYPNNFYTAEILFQLGSELFEKGKPSDAILYFDKVIKQFPYSSFAAKAQPLKASSLLQSGKFEEACSALNAIVESDEMNAFTALEPYPDLYIMLAAGYAQIKNIKNAKAYYLKYLETEPTGVSASEALTALGNYARTEGNIDLATSYFKRAGELSNGTASKRQVADLLFQQGNYTEAIPEYKAVLKGTLSEDDQRIVESKIILAQFRSDDFSEAVKGSEQFQHKYEKDKESIAALLLEEGIYYFKKEDNTKARKVFQRILDDFDETPSVPFSLYWSGRIEEFLNHTDEAINIIQKVIQQYPNSPVLPRAEIALGNIYFRQEQYENAVKYYRYITDSSSDSEILPLAMNNLIIAYKEVGIYDAALQLTRKFIEQYPNDESILDKRIDIGILYQKLGYYDQAIVHFQHILDEANEDLEAEIRYYIGECYYYQKQFQQALLEFLKVPYLIKKKTKIDWSANAFYMAGQSYEKMGKYEQAIGMYKQIIDRTGLDAAFKSAAEKEINRVKALIQQGEAK